MNIKKTRVIESIPSRGIFGSCSCGAEILYYTDRGVRCSTCFKLYGVWADKYQSQIKRTLKIIEETQKIRSEDEIIHKDIEQISIKAK